MSGYIERYENLEETDSSGHSNERKKVFKDGVAFILEELKKEKGS